MKYKMLEDSKINSEVKCGDIVYSCSKPDYGLASNDTAMTGIHHISVTLNEDGDYPFFTVPYHDLEIIS